MKKIHLILALVFVTAMAAQGRFREKLDQVKAQKTAFITNELQLTPDESAKFWPLYNAFEDRQRDIRRQRVSAYLDRRNGAEDKLSDKEASVLLAQMEDNEDQLYQARKKLVADLKTFLPPVKILKLKKAEEDFNKKLLQQIRQRRN